MGDLQAWVPHQNGFLADYNPSLNSPAPNPQPSEIDGECWVLAEKATEGVIENIQATFVSEKRRHQVVEYVQKLIRYHLNCEVFPFGSVPLKTYLPDGDIDLTAFGLPNSEDVLATNVRHVLELEERNSDAEFEVKDVQYIHAEVKLVKCLVQNIVVDISFNQSGGLSTLCFLEQVDRLIGKDHLFKRSIILIKAWCYYESRILGAHHGLISTYALETLVLYIFHLFHSSLDGPLVVLYRFLDYYSKFDWESYCISLHGPVSISSLPELVAEAPENDGAELLFTKEYLKNCVDNFAVLPRGFESSPRGFPQKHLNVVDPLKENNNLGRSISRGNFYRIRSAFTYGARKLGRLLLQLPENITAEVNAFFINTLDRHGSDDERPNVHNLLPNGTNSSPSSEPKDTDASGQLCEELNTINISSPISTVEENNSANGKACLPHLFFNSENGHQNEEATISSHLVSCETESSVSANVSRASSLNTENSKPEKLADLSGDYDLHFRNLLHVQWSLEYLSGNIYPFYAQSPSYQYHNKNYWDSSSRRRGSFSHMNGVGPGSQFLPSGSYPVNSPFSSGAYGVEDLSKPRGTGTYFPITSFHGYRERHSPGRGKKAATSNYFSRHRSFNGRAESSQETNVEEKGVNHEPLPHVQLPVSNGNGRGINSPRLSFKESSSANGSVVPPEELKFGSLGPLQLRDRSPDSPSSQSQSSSGSNHERNTQAYQLKDDGDFPPLSG